jgi:hypothetical protein
MLQCLFPTEIVLKEDSAQSSGAPPLDPSLTPLTTVQDNTTDYLEAPMGSSPPKPLAVFGNPQILPIEPSSLEQQVVHPLALKSQERKPYSVVLAVKILK